MLSFPNVDIVLILVHLINALIISFIFHGKRDLSARLWVCGSLLHCLARGSLYFLSDTQSFEKYFLSNFFELYATVIYGYSLTQLSSVDKKKKVFDIALCTLGASIIFIFYKLDCVDFVRPAYEICCGVINIYIYARLKKSNKKELLSFSLISYSFLAYAMILLIPLTISLISNLIFVFVFETEISRYIFTSVLFILLLSRQIGYLVLRSHLIWTDRLDEADGFARSVQTQMLKSLNALSLARDNETGNHILRTQWYVKEIATKLMADGHYTKQLNEQSIDAMFQVAPLHDIGKVGIPDSVLLKPDSLDSAEWAIMKTHAMIGETILQAAIEGDQKYTQLLQIAIEIAGGHHERWNGTGYPRGLIEQEIPLAARIMSIADIYDALVSARVYKKKWSHSQAINEIERKSGEYFDPVVVKAFLSIQHRIQTIATVHADAD